MLTSFTLQQYLRLINVSRAVRISSVYLLSTYLIQHPRALQILFVLSLGLLFSTKQGIAKENLFAISGVAGKGVTPVIRRARKLLSGIEDDSEWSTGVPALNHQQPPKEDQQENRIDNYSIEELTHLTPRVWVIHGKALEKFTQMTNWNYYESLRR